MWSAEEHTELNRNPTDIITVDSVRRLIQLRIQENNEREDEARRVRENAARSAAAHGPALVNFSTLKKSSALVPKKLDQKGESKTGELTPAKSTKLKSPLVSSEKMGSTTNSPTSVMYFEATRPSIAPNTADKRTTADKSESPVIPKLSNLALNTAGTKYALMSSITTITRTGGKIDKKWPGRKPTSRELGP